MLHNALFVVGLALITLLFPPTPFVIKAYKDKNLPEEKIRALEEMGFDFTIKPKKKGAKKTIWEQKFEELEDYKAKHGDLSIPENYEKSPQLAPWLSELSHASLLAL